MPDNEKKMSESDWTRLKEEFQAELWKKAEVINKYDVKKIKPTNTNLILEDDDENVRVFKLISIAGRGGVLGEPVAISPNYITSLTKKYRAVYPFISRIDFFEKPYFPFAKDEDVVKFSPLFILVQNQAYIMNKIDPYNVELCGFLINYIPIKGIYLEAVTKSVAGTIATCEDIMVRNKQPYTRKNHLLNWLYLLLSKDSRNLKISIFNMQTKYMASFKDYMASISKND